jgi:hypothetical protein
MSEDGDGEGWQKPGLDFINIFHKHKNWTFQSIAIMMKIYQWANVGASSLRTVNRTCQLWKTRPHQRGCWKTSMTMTTRFGTDIWRTYGAVCASAGLDAASDGTQRPLSDRA